MTIGVIGGGGWGTALAAHLAGKGHEVRLWVYEEDLAERIRGTRENDRFLPGVLLPPQVAITSRLAEAAGGAECCLLVTPSHALRAVATKLVSEAPLAVASLRTVVIATKGLEPETLKRMSEVVDDALAGGRTGAGAGAAAATAPVVLAGPSHAEEVARGIPTAVVAASRDRARAAEVQQTFSTEAFRVYTNDDVVGVEIAVALKNVVAVAAGISDGLGFGDSTKGALLARGLAEIARLGAALGAKPETFWGLAGLGDLVATATSRHSRNRRLGEAVGKGATLAEAVAASPMVAEGVQTARAAVSLAKLHNVELPIAEQVRAILFEGKSARDALRELLARDLKSEDQTLARR